MTDVRPFRGLRFDLARVGGLGAVLCPPFGALDAAHEPVYRQHHPYNAIRLEISRSASGPAQQESALAAGATVRRWRSERVLRPESRPAFYLHELRFDHNGRTLVRRELVAAVGLRAWGCRIVLPHERTFERATAERVRHLSSAGANVSPILAFFERGGLDPDAITLAWSWADRHEPVAEGTDLEGHAHRLWVLDDDYLGAGLERFFCQRQIFIADGHHRYEAALLHRYAVARSRQREEATGAEQFVLMHLVATDDPGLVVLPTHRVIRGLGELNVDELVARLGGDLVASTRRVSDVPVDVHLDAYLAILASLGRRRPTVAVIGPTAYDITFISSGSGLSNRSGRSCRSASEQSLLDVVLADRAVIAPMLTVGAMSTEKAVSYTHAAHDAVSQVLNGDAQFAVLLNPTRIRQIVDIARRGERMPEKSTCFYPKPPVGLVLHPFDQAPARGHLGPDCVDADASRRVGA